MASTAAPGPVDLLRAELERLFDLDALQKLSRDLLNLDPDEVLPNANRATFARALAERALRDDLQEALADAILLTDHGAEERLRPVYDGRVSDELATGSTVAGFKIQKKLHDEGFGSVYQAHTADGKTVHLKVLREGRARDRRALQRFLLAQRAIGQIDHPGVQRVEGAGLLPDGRPYVATEPVDGQLLSARLARAGAMHINEARGVLQAITEALDKVHAAGLAHADLRTDHVMLVRRDGALSAVLVDFAIDRLASHRGGHTDMPSLLVVSGSARALAPERIRRGDLADARSDVYGLGALTYEVLTGKPLFGTANSAELIVAHLTQEPEAPSKLAPRGWVSKDLDAVVMMALAKNRDDRPSSAGQFFQLVVDAVKGRTAAITREEFDARKSALQETPTDDDKALALEASGNQGIPWADVVTALTAVVDATEDEAAKKALRFRLARVLEAEVKDLPAARAAYESIGDDPLAKAKARDIKRATATAEERAEMILEDIEDESMAGEKSRLWRDLAHLYERDLHDRDNAVVAITEAVSAAPADDDLAAELERLLGDDGAKWSEPLGTLSEGARGREPAEAVALFLRAGRWYLDKVKRADFALACFNQAIGVSPGHDEALGAAAEIYRRQSQWGELVGTLLKRADAQTSAQKSRDLRAEACDVLEAKLDETTKSREMVEKVLHDDPTHDLAGRVYERLLLRTEDWAGVVKLLERKADALTGERKAEALCELAEVYEDRLKDAKKTAEFFEQARLADPRNLAALKGLERLYAKGDDHAKMVSVLEAQVDVAATPRQKVELYNRIGALQEEEFVAHEKAAAAFEEALKIDPANDTALRGLGRLYRVLSRWEDLATLLERHAGLVDDPTKKVELLLSAGRVLMDPIGSVERAAKCYERVLEIEKGNTVALDATARISALQGDVRRATEAYDQLAAAAKTPTEKVEVLLKAGRVLEDKGDRDGAITRYKQALDADPDSAAATARLRELYATRGDAQGAIELLQREIAAADGENQRASLWAQVARIYRDRVKDRDKARDAAEKATLLDPSQEDASTLLGEIRFEEEKWADAARLLGPRAARVKELGREVGLPLALKYGEALARSGEGAKSLEAFRSARDLAPDDREVLAAVANATVATGAWAEARTYYGELLSKHGHELDRDAKVEALLRLAEAHRKASDNAGALKALQEASELDPTNVDAVEQSVALHVEDGRWDEVVKLKRRLVELATSDTQRYALHLEVADLLSAKLGDKARSAKAYVSALEIKPDDRKILMRLMQLYSDEKDYGRLVEVILKFTDLVEDRAQLAKYYLTAAQLSDVHLHRPEEAIDYYEQALENDPQLPQALKGIAALRGARKDWAGLEQSYRKVLGKLPETGAGSQRASIHAQLGALYEAHLKQPSDAVAEYERAMELAPGEHDFSEKLAALYLTDSKRYHERAVGLHRGVLARDPVKVESLHALRRVYTEAKKPDEAWCLCQALVSVKGAEPEEENFYKKFRTEGPIVAQEKLNDERWRADLVHPLQDHLLTSVFATILPAVQASRAVTRDVYGLKDSMKIDPKTYESQASQTVHYAAGVLGFKVPDVYVREDDDSGISVTHTDPPALLLGKVALAGGPAKALAFLVGSRLAYLRAGHHVRLVVPTGTGLRQWLFAAIRAVQPTFPVSAELAGPVGENVATIKKHLPGASMEVLSSLVGKVVQSETSLDLRRWMMGVELTADRAGFVLANDLAMSVAVIQATGEDQSSVTQADRVRELRAYAVSESYFRLRHRLGIAMTVQGQNG